MKTDEKQCKDYYEKVIEAYSESARNASSYNEAVLLTDPVRHYKRFSEITQHIDASHERASILDVGCGNGEMYSYLTERSIACDYKGIDICEDLVVQANARFQSNRFEVLDIFDASLSEKEFDYVIMSTIFNLRHGQTLEYVHNFLKRMYTLCSHACIWNMLSTHVNYMDDDFCYYSPSDMLDFAISELSPCVILSHHQVSYNYTVAAFRQA